MRRCHRRTLSPSMLLLTSPHTPLLQEVYLSRGWPHKERVEQRLQNLVWQGCMYLCFFYRKKSRPSPGNFLANRLDSSCLLSLFRKSGSCSCDVLHEEAKTGRSVRWLLFIQLRQSLVLRPAVVRAGSRVNGVNHQSVITKLFLDRPGLTSCFLKARLGPVVLPSQCHSVYASFCVSLLFNLV